LVLVGRPSILSKQVVALLFVALTAAAAASASSHSSSRGQRSGMLSRSIRWLLLFELVAKPILAAPAKPNPSSAFGVLLLQRFLFFL
jgi:hypothetical protein